MALRMVESGVRMVQVYFGNGQPWDNHDDIRDHAKLAREADARLRRCIVTDGVRVPPGSSWENKTIRVAHGELMESEQLVGELAIGPIDG